jgi:hypothetical protein
VIPINVMRVVDLVVTWCIIDVPNVECVAWSPKSII